MGLLARQSSLEFFPARRARAAASRVLAMPRKRKAFIVGDSAIAMVRFRASLVKELIAQGYEVVCAAPPADAETERQLATIGARFLPISMTPDRTLPLHDLRT